MMTVFITDFWILVYYTKTNMYVICISLCYYCNVIIIAMYNLWQDINNTYNIIIILIIK